MGCAGSKPPSDEELAPPIELAPERLKGVPRSLEMALSIKPPGKRSFLEATCTLDDGELSYLLEKKGETISLGIQELLPPRRVGRTLDLYVQTRGNRPLSFRLASEEDLAKWEAALMHHTMHAQHGSDYEPPPTPRARGRGPAVPVTAEPPVAGGEGGDGAKPEPPHTPEPTAASASAAASAARLTSGKKLANKSKPFWETKLEREQEKGRLKKLRDADAKADAKAEAVEASEEASTDAPSASDASDRADDATLTARPTPGATPLASPRGSVTPRPGAPLTLEERVSRTG